MADEPTSTSTSTSTSTATFAAAVAADVIILRAEKAAAKAAAAAEVAAEVPVAVCPTTTTNNSIDGNDENYYRAFAVLNKRVPIKNTERQQLLLDFAQLDIISFMSDHYGDGSDSSVAKNKIIDIYKILPEERPSVTILNKSWQKDFTATNIASLYSSWKTYKESHPFYHGEAHPTTKDEKAVLNFFDGFEKMMDDYIRTKKTAQDKCDRLKQENANKRKSKEPDTIQQQKYHPPINDNQILQSIIHRYNFFITIGSKHIVYVLPSPYNAWDVCACGFTTGSSQAFQIHISNCQYILTDFDTKAISYTYPYKCSLPHSPLNKTQYEDLIKRGPIVGFCFRNHKQFLRLHSTSVVACVCGMEYKHQKSIQIYHNKCTYLEKFFERQKQSSLISVEQVVPLIEPPQSTYGGPMKNSNAAKMKTVEYNKVIKAFPRTIPGATINIPSISSSRSYDICNRLNSVIISHYKVLVELVDNPSGNYENDFLWGGTRIQADRIMIRLSSDEEGGNQCLVEFLKKCEFPEGSIHELISIAKEKSNNDENNKPNNHYHNFYLIISTVVGQQEVHIDTLKSNHQYGMPISNGVHSTIIYDINKIPRAKQIKNTDQLVQLFNIKEYFPEELLPTMDCFNAISTIDPNSMAAENISNFGILFNIINTSHMEETSMSISEKKSSFDYESFVVTNCTPGTITSVPGGIMHAGSGSNHNNIRCLMFWTAYSSENISQRYNSDDQITKLTLIIDITLELWIDLLNDSIERKNLIGMIYYFLLHSSCLYRTTATAHYVDNYHLHQLLVTMLGLITEYKKKGSKKKHKTLSYVKMCNTFSKVNLLCNSSDENKKQNKKQKTNTASDSDTAMKSTSSQGKSENKNSSLRAEEE